MDTLLVTDDHRNTLGMQLTRRLGQLLGESLVSFSQATEIANFILNRIDRANYHEEIIELLLELNTQWPYFEANLQFERVTVQAEQDKRKAAVISETIKKEQIDTNVSTPKNS